MYITDLLKRLSSKENIPIVIYLILNVFVTGGILYLFTGGYENFAICLGIGLILYMISVVIALSPVGEFIVRLQTGCRKIKRVDQINYLEPIFREVYIKAKKADPSIPDDVRLFINSDEAPNAFATGRKTICVTAGLLQLPSDDIKAVLGHEMGHLAHKDTDLIMLISVGNMIVNGFIIIVRAIIVMISFIMSICGIMAGGTEGAIYKAMTSLGQLMVTALVGFLVKMWTKLGIVLCMKSSREQEFLADEFSFNLGYGKDLCAFLDAIEGSEPKGLFATLSASHPASDDRIARLQKLGVQYTTTYATGSNNVKPSSETVNSQPVAAARKIKPVPAMGLADGTVSVEKINNASVRMIACPSCGNMLSTDSKFCNQCGSKIEIPNKLICPGCGKEADEEDSVFCVYCGTKLTD